MVLVGSAGVVDTCNETHNLLKLVGSLRISVLVEQEVVSHGTHDCVAVGIDRER